MWECVYLLGDSDNHNDLKTSVCDEVLKCLNRDKYYFYRTDLEYYNDDCVSLYDILSYLNKRIKHRMGNETDSAGMFCVNSKFSVYMDLFQIILYPSTKHKFKDNEAFLLEYNVKQQNYILKNADQKLMNLVDNQEEEIFKNVFVPILSCPEWMHYDLERIKDLKISKNNIKIMIKKFSSLIKK